MMDLCDRSMELREIETLEGHTDRVWSLAWNPATTAADCPALLASCSGDKTVRIWERAPSTRFWHCKAVLEESHTRTVRSCAWSPSGKLLATVSFDATTAIWENIGGDFECISTLEGHENEVKSVTWNASGSLLATCSRDKTVWIWEVMPGNEFECASVLQGHKQDVKMVKWHPTMDILFSCSYDNTVKVWAEDGTGDWNCIQTLDESSNGHSSCKVSGEEMQLFESNHKERSKTMVEYYSNLQACYEEIHETEQTKRRKSRAMGGAVALSAASNGLASEGSKETKQGSSGGQGQQRRIWVKDRDRAWWDDCNRPEFPEVEFKKAFRMSKSTFDMICEDLNSVIAKEDTALRNAIPVRQRVAVCIWRLATGEPLRLVSKRFGLGISTCHKLVLEVCSAIRNVLMPKYLQWPDDDGLRKLKNEFESISDIPNVVGSMYTTHIPIIAPKISVAAYFNKRHTERNQKTSYSITLQGVVNPKGVFTDVCIGWPGSMPDDQVLEKSALYQRANGGLLKDVWIVGSSGYPLMDWILVPYTQQNLTWTQHAFNERIGDIQRIVKDAFARLKGRWVCLQKRTEVKLQDLPIVLGACCVLHNICEMHDEEMDPELKIELVDDEMIPEVALRSGSSVKARDAIAHNLLHHRRAGTGFL